MASRFSRHFFKSCNLLRILLRANDCSTVEYLRDALSVSDIK